MQAAVMIQSLFRYFMTRLRVFARWGILNGDVYPAGDVFWIHLNGIELSLGMDVHQRYRRRQTYENQNREMLEHYGSFLQAGMP